MTTAYSSLAFSISPCAKPKNKKKDEDETYMLTLAPFTRPPKISFGTVKVNESVEKSLLIVNPQDFRMELNVVNSELNINNIKLFIDKGETVALKLKWEPTKPDNYRYTINFEVLNSLKLKFVVHAYGICEKIDPKKKTAVRRPPFKVLQPIKTKKDETENTAPPSQEKTILMRPAAEQQENRPTFGMEIHNRTQLIEKPKKLSYDDDFYRSEFNYTNTFIDANSTTHHSGHIINSTTNVVNSTAMIDRRQTSVISTPKLNFYRSIDSLNVASIAEDASMRMKSPLRRSTSVREIYMEETIIKASSSLRGSSTAEDVETTIYSVPETVASLISKQHSRSPGTPKLSDYLRTPCAKGRHWTQVHEQDRTSKYAVLCQRAIRMKRFRIRLRMLKLSLAQTTAALVIQRQWRMKIFRRRMTRFRRAAVTIQRWFRRVKAARDERRRIELERKILTERLNLFINVRSAKTIQRWYREILRRRAEFERKRLEAVLSVQSTWRMILAKRRFEVKMAAIVKIQRWFKVKRAARIERERRQAELERKRLESVVSVQSMWRMILAKRRFEAKMTAIVKIQRWFKVKRAKRIEYERKLLIAVVLAQKRWRMICARKVYQSKLKSALLIQTIYRGKSARERFVAKKRQHLAAIALQSQWRMISARNRFRQIQQSIRLIQTWYRTNRDLKKRNQSATLIQATWRGYITRKRLVEAARREAAVVQLQSTWRMIVARRRFKNLLKSVRFIQTAFREARRRKLNASATLIQATWRGYITRKKFYAAEKERKQKLQKSAAASSHIPVRRSAANTDQSRTLGARIRNSLQLLTCSDASIPLPNIIYSLNDLQTVTRLSPECCEIFVRESATYILFGFIANCNRSVPHMDMIKLCLDIILNLARYSKTVGGICSDDQAAFQTLFNLLQAYQLSNQTIFMSVCVIMILLHRHGYLGETQMASVGGREKFQFKLTSIYIALEKRRQNTRTAATPTQSSSTRSKKWLFTLEPEWQLAKSSQSIEFVDSLNALESLLSELGMRHTMTTSSSAVVSSTSVRRPIPRRDAQTPVSAVGTHTYSTRSTAAASSRKIEYAEIDENTIICNDNNASVLSNVTIRGFNEEPHLNSTRNHQ